MMNGENHRSAADSTMESAAEFDRPLFSGRRVVLAGCIAVLGIMCFSTIDICLSLSRTSAKSSQMIASFRERTRILEELRSVTIRRGMVNRDRIAGSAAGQASDLPANRQQAEQLLDEFESLSRRDSDSDTLAKLAALRMAVDAYWDSSQTAAETNSPLPGRGRTESAQPAPNPLRIEISRLSHDITDLNNHQLDVAEAQIRSEQNQLQARLLLASIIEICVTFILIFAISLRVKKTEQFAEMQYRKIVQARAELRDLTARLENVQEDERRNLSHELHDEVGQAMATVLLELGRFGPEEFKDDAARERLVSLKAQVEGAMRSVRDLALILRPSMLDDLGLVPALKWQGREVARRTGLSIRVEAEESADTLPDPYRTCIYRIVQEALHNVVKHARATAVTVSFRRAKDHLDLRIEDNGQGFNPSAEKGLGLLGMEERVARLGGRVRVSSNLGAGTSIDVLLPSPA
jgi:signal transduction histidine kinase